MARTNSAYPDSILFERASKFTRRGDLKKYDNKAYQALHRRGLLDQACANMEPSITAAYSLEEMDEEAKKHLTKMAFRKANQSMYDVAYKRGVLPIICSHMPENVSLVLGKDRKWSLKVLKERANKHNKKIDFYKKDPKAYAAAYVKGWLDEICADMEESYRNWTKEEVAKAFLLCSSKGEVQKRFSRAYAIARENGLEYMAVVSSHMKNRGGSSIAEKEIFAMIKGDFKDAIKIKDRDVNIKDKPYIKAFEIDVYVPSLKRGIEYDGTRFHSFEFMRKDRHKRFWSDEDIVNYHKIKDEWFWTSKGITLLHIKEEAWDTDKEACIKLIKDFLEIGA